MPRSAVDRAVRVARRRLFVQALSDRLGTSFTVALGVGLLWVLIEPLLLTSPPASLRWEMLGVLIVFTVVAAFARSIRRAPSHLLAALEIDARFGLRERITTVVGLSPIQRAAPSGMAVLADAETHALALRVRQRFPFRMRRSLVWVLLLAGLIAVIAFVWHPATDSLAWVEGTRTVDKAAPAKRVAESGQRSTLPMDRKPRTDQQERPGKSPAVKELEAELDRLEREAREATPEEAREKLTEATGAEEKAKALEQEKTDKLARLEQKLRQLETLAGEPGFKGGPAQKLADALANGDLKQAEEAADELRKKVKDQKLDPMEAGQLAQQLDRMKNELQRLARNKDEQDKVRDLIDQARKEGRDTESLDRELERLKAEAARTKGLDDLAEKLEAARKAVEQGDAAAAAEQLEAVAGQMKDLQGEVQDLKDTKAARQRAAQLKAAAAQQAAEGGQPGGAQQTASGTSIGSGTRPENPNALTASGQDAREPTPFDGKGRKTYGGPIVGPAFTKASPTELGPAIIQAVQEAPGAIASQPVTRDDKDAVKEFFQPPADRK